MYIEFLHCNACFSYSANSEQTRFWLTECGHVVCHKCLNKGSIDIKKKVNSSSSPSNDHNCPVCNTKCSAVELTEKLPPNLGMFFRPAHEILGEAADVLKFQQTNTFSLLNFLKDKVIKQKQMLDKAKNELLQHKDLKNQLLTLKDENQRLKTQLQEIHSSSSISIKKKVESSPLRPKEHHGHNGHNVSPREIRKSSNCVHHHHHQSPTSKPRTPNPPSRLSLQNTNSPARATYQEQNHEYHYHRNDTNQSPYNAHNAHNEDGGERTYYQYEQQPPPGDLSNLNNTFNQFTPRLSVQSFSKQRMTWNEFYNNNSNNNFLRNVVPGSTNYSSSREFRPPIETNFQSSSRLFSSRPYSSDFTTQNPPRTPVTRKRGALPGYK